MDRGCKELDATEQLTHTHTSLFLLILVIVVKYTFDTINIIHLIVYLYQ